MNDLHAAGREKPVTIRSCSLTRHRNGQIMTVDHKINGHDPDEFDFDDEGGATPILAAALVAPKPGRTPAPHFYPYEEMKAENLESFFTLLVKEENLLVFLLDDFTLPDFEELAWLMCYLDIAACTLGNPFRYSTDSGREHSITSSHGLAWAFSSTLKILWFIISPEYQLQLGLRDLPIFGPHLLPHLSSHVNECADGRAMDDGPDQDPMVSSSQVIVIPGLLSQRRSNGPIELNFWELVLEHSGSFVSLGGLVIVDPGFILLVFECWFMLQLKDSSSSEH
ncbi:hypothetical protein M5K25_001917 [Dendrobium thyrsiflorum]|uniref:Uncharacterized protein n=1 Tax=Dendrobium thyrsiflorum TaxID=117978 RepID=A0ABD0W074_DENTH